MSIDKLSGRIATEYHQDEILTAQEFNKIPSKINEIIENVNNLSSLDDETLEDLSQISNRITENANNISQNSQSIVNIENDITDLRNTSFNLYDNISSQSITDIDPYSEIKLGIDAFGKLCLIKTNDISVSADIMPRSFEIDSEPHGYIQIEILVQPKSEVDTINVISDNGTLIQGEDIYHWKLSGITSTTTLTVTVNGKNPRSFQIPFTDRKSGIKWSEELLEITEFERPSDISEKGFYLAETPNSLIKADNVQKYWYVNHPDKTTPMYLYIITSTFVPQDQLRTKFFLYGSSISGGMDYIGEIMQYSNTIPYYVYKTNDKIDTSITVEIR